jgi:hypothetical protein
MYRQHFTELSRVMKDVPRHPKGTNGHFEGTQRALEKNQNFIRLTPRRSLVASNRVALIFFLAEGKPLMKKQDEKTLVVAVATMMIGAVLLSDPKCSRGCQTLAEHLWNHGFDDLLGTFLL